MEFFFVVLAAYDNADLGDNRRVAELEVAIILDEMPDGYLAFEKLCPFR